MDRNPTPKNYLSVAIHTEDKECKIELVPDSAGRSRRIRLSNSRGGQPLAGQIELTEKELVTLLALAHRAGVISPDFIRSLRAEFEI